MDIDADAECETGFRVDCDVSRLRKVPANSTENAVGEKFARVVGLGASRDIGGFVLGFRIGGDSGKGVSDKKFCLPNGEVTVDGGESGIEF